MLFSEKGEGSSHTRLVPKHKAEGERRKNKEQLGQVRSERLKELKREEYRRKDKEVKASTQADKRRMIDRMDEDVESAARDNNFSDL